MRKFCTTSFVLLFNIVLLAQSPGGVSGQVAWLIPEPMTGDVYGQYHWVDYSGYSRVVYSHQSGASPVEFLQPADSLYFLNFHPAMSLSTDSLILNLPERRMPQYTLIGVFAPKTDTSLWPTVRIDRSEYETATLAKAFLSHDTDSLYLPTYSISKPRVVTIQHSNAPCHSAWGDSDGAGNIVVSPLFPDGNPGFQGYCAEIIVYERMLNPLERCQIETYLALKYGITHTNSYFDRAGNQIWAKNPYSSTYEFRMMGVMCDSVNRFCQVMTTISEYPFHLAIPENSSNLGNLPDEVPTENRPLVFGVEDGQPFPDGSYAILGASNAPYTMVTADSTWFVTKRKWLARTNSSSLFKAELSYKYLPGFKPYRFNRSYLVISSSDTTQVTPPADILIRSTDFDATRQKIIFHDIPLDTDGDGRDLLAFAWSEDFLTEVTPYNATCDGATPLSDGSISVKVISGSPSYEYVVYTYADTLKTGSSGTNLFSIGELPSGIYNLSLRQREATSLYTGSEPYTGTLSTSISDLFMQRRFSWCICDTVSSYQVYLKTSSGSNIQTLTVSGNHISISGANSSLNPGDSIVIVYGSGLLKVLHNEDIIYTRSQGSYSPMTFAVGNMAPRSSVADLRYNEEPMSFSSPTDAVLVENSLGKSLAYRVKIGSECGSTSNYAHLVTGNSNAKPSFALDDPGDTASADTMLRQKNQPLQINSASDHERKYIATLRGIRSGTSILLVYDAAGRLLLRQSFDSTGRVEFTLPYAGVFLVKALADSEEFTEKITTR